MRRAKVKRRPELKTTRYIWLSPGLNPGEPRLSAEQRERLVSLSRTNLETVRAYRLPSGARPRAARLRAAPEDKPALPEGLRLAFQDVYDQPTHPRV